MPIANSVFINSKTEFHKPFFSTVASERITSHLLSCKRLQSSVCILNRKRLLEEYLRLTPLTHRNVTTPSGWEEGDSPSLLILKQ